MNKFILNLLTVLIALFFTHCRNSGKKEFDKSTMFCGAENLSEDGGVISRASRYGGGKGQSEEEAYEGKYSCLLYNGLKKGFQIELHDLIPGEIIEASVYRKSTTSNGYLTITTPDYSIFQNEKGSLGGKDADGWEKLILEIQVPFDLDSTKIPSLLIYVANPKPKTEKVYIDNLVVKRTPPNEKKEYKNEDVALVNIQIAETDYKQITRLRDQAFYQGVIGGEQKQEVPGILSYKGKNIGIKLRLKGDWGDHIVSKKWSFRIKTNKNQSFKGLKEFSLQNLKTRDYVNEWLVHEIFKEEDLLTTKYGFYPVKVNGNYLGVYALEEHFVKQLLESKDRREGPILKISEEGFWECNLYTRISKNLTNKPVYLAADIIPFKTKKTLKDERLRKQFLVAQNLMSNYKLGKDGHEEYMDVEKWAKAYALMSVLNVDHSFVWHNQRFYYNPVLSKLELITFDCYAGTREMIYRTPKILGNTDQTNLSDTHYSLLSIFNNKLFQKKYINYLKKYSNPEYLTNIFSKKDSIINEYQELISTDYEGYRFDKTIFLNSSKTIYNEINSYEKKLNNNEIKFTLKQEETNECYPEDIFEHISLNVYLDQQKPKTLSLINYHCSTIEVVGYESSKVKDSLVYFSSPLIIDQFKDNGIKKIQYSGNKPPKNVFYKQKGLDSLFDAKVYNWPRPISETMNNDAFKTPKLDELSKNYTIDKKKSCF